MPVVAPFSPSQAGQGLELTGEDWLDQVVTPLEAESVVMSMPNVNVHHTDVALHIPIMREVVTDESVWVAPNGAVPEFDPATAGMVLMGRNTLALKMIVKISNESMRSSQALQASQVTIVNQMRKILDKAILQGDVTAGITGLLNEAGTTIKHSRTVADAATATSTGLTSATAAFTSADVGATVSGAGIVPGTTIASVTNATTVVLSAATTATAAGVTVTITSSESILAQFVDALTIAQDAYSDPKYWIVNAQTVGVLRKLTDTLGRPLLQPDLTQQGAEMILGRTVIPAPAGALPHGTAMLVDPRTIHVAIDLLGYIRILLETYAGFDQTGLLVVTRADAGCTIPAGLVVLSGLGPN